MAQLTQDFTGVPDGDLDTVAGWESVGATGGSPPTIVNEQINPQGGSFSQVLYTAFEPETPDYSIEGDFTIGAHGNSAGGLSLRAGSPSAPDVWRCHSVWWNNGKWELVFRDNQWAATSIEGQYTVAQGHADDPSSGVVRAKFEVVSNTFKVYINGTERLSHNHFIAVLTGYAGITWDSLGSTGRWDNLVFEDYSVPVPHAEATDIGGGQPFSPGSQVVIAGTNHDLLTAVNLSDGTRTKVQTTYTVDSPTQTTVTIDQGELAYSSADYPITLELVSGAESESYAVTLVPVTGMVMIEIVTPIVDDAEQISLLDNATSGDPALVEQILAPAQSDSGHLITYNDDGTFEIAAGTGGDGLTGVRYWDGEWSNPVNHSIVEIGAEPEEPPEEPEEPEEPGDLVNVTISKGLLKPLLKALTRAI